MLTLDDARKIVREFRSQASDNECDKIVELYIAVKEGSLNMMEAAAALLAFRVSEYANGQSERTSRTED